jgi:hypothetical protein
MKSARTPLVIHPQDDQVLVTIERRSRPTGWDHIPHDKKLIVSIFHDSNIDTIKTIPAGSHVTIFSGSFNP